MAGAGSRHVSVRRSAAAERSPGYAIDAPLTAAEALERLADGVTALAEVDWDAEDVTALADAAESLQREANRLAGQQLRNLAAVQRHDAIKVDGAVSPAAWYRHRTGMDHAAAARMVKAAWRLQELPALRAALDDGDITLAHVTTVTSAAVPTRMAAFVEADATMAKLARSAPPATLRTAVRFLTDQTDPDGSDPKPLRDGPDERRFHDQWLTVDGLMEYRGLCDPGDGELMRAVLDAYEHPDPPGTPAEQRRSAGQRRADALAAALSAASGAEGAPTVHGAKPHILGMLDLAKVMGRADLATFEQRLRYTGEADWSLIERVLADAKFTAVLTLGPWRVVNVGRTHRTLPTALRPMLQMLHRTCRGPTCDRPAAWTQAHHETDWTAGGDTDLNATIALCQAHHDLVTTGGWTVTLDLHTGVCTWTSPDGRTIQTRPP